MVLCHSSKASRHGRGPDGVVLKDSGLASVIGKGEQPEPDDEEPDA